MSGCTMGVSTLGSQVVCVKCGDDCVLEEELTGAPYEGDEVVHWYAGWNLAGYSSDPDTVLHGVTIGEALGYLREALEHEYDQFLPEEQAHAELVMNAILAVDLLGDDVSVIERDAELRRSDSGHWSVFAGPYVYWIMPCRAVHCDQVNTEYGDEE